MSDLIFIKRIKRKWGPTRAMLAESPAGDRATATWEQKPDLRWTCVSASNMLRPMIGADQSQAQGILAMLGLKWRWIEKTVLRRR